MIVFLGGAGEASRIVYHGLEAAGVSIARAVIEDSVPRSQLIRRRIHKLGLSRVVGQLAFQGLIVPLLTKTSRRRIGEIKRQFGLNDAPIPAGVVSRVSSVNAPETLALLTDLRPTVVVVNGTRIISKSVLEGMPATFINIHAGITPSYRGVHGGYWARVENRPDACGVTVHLVDPGIDTGGVLAQALITPGPSDNFATYPYLQLAAGLPLLANVARQLEDGFAPPVLPNAGGSVLRSHPTLVQYLYYRLTRGAR